MPDVPNDPMALMAALRLEDGSRWGEVAEPWQVDDTRAILAPGPGDPRQVLSTRPKGGSKSTDKAGESCVWLLCQAAPLDVGYAAAADLEQASRLLERAAGLIRRTPGLDRMLKVQANAIVNRKNGAQVRAVAADAAGLEGILSPWLVVDELFNWPTSRNAQAMWTAIVSSVPKVRGCRLSVIGHAGTTGGIWHKVYESCAASPRWLVHDVPGPLPWIDPQALEDQRAMLTPSAFERRHMNRWAADEDALTTIEDLRACVVLDGPMVPRPGVRYVVAVDVGLTNDRTVGVVCHAESIDGADAYGRPIVTPQPSEVHSMHRGLLDTGRISYDEFLARTRGREGLTKVRPVRIVLDRMQVWQGSKGAPVPLPEVEEWIADSHYLFNRAALIYDPYQMAGSAQRLAVRGVETEAYAFSSASVGRLANVLFQLLRDRALALPDDEALLDELASVRIVERTPGVMRMDHDAGSHDDRAIALALAAWKLLQTPPPPPPATVTAYENAALDGSR